MLDGNALKRIRRENEISLNELSAFSKISVEVIKKIEENSIESDIPIIETLLDNINQIEKIKGQLKEDKKIKEERIKLEESLLADINTYETKKSYYKLYQTITLTLTFSISTILFSLAPIFEGKLDFIEKSTSIFYLLLLLTGFFICFFVIILVFKKYIVNPKEKIKIKEKRINELNIEASKGNIAEDFFNSMIKISIDQSSNYYSQTQEQAEKSFLLAKIASSIGLVIITLGIILVFINKTTPGYLATMVGVIIEFIAGVIFYLYNKTIIKMSEYHKKLILSQNILIALKTTEDFISEEKMKIRSQIVGEIIKDVNKYLSEK